MPFQQEDIFSPVITEQSHFPWMLLTREHWENLIELSNLGDFISASEGSWNCYLQVFRYQELWGNISKLVELYILVLGLDPLENIEVDVPSLVHICWVLGLLKKVCPKLSLLKITSEALIEIDLVHSFWWFFHVFM